MKTSKEIFIAGIRIGNEYKQAVFPNEAYENMLWNQFLEENTVVDLVPQKKLSGRVFLEETENKIKSGQKIIPLEMNDEGEL